MSNSGHVREQNRLLGTHFRKGKKVANNNRFYFYCKNCNERIENREQRPIYHLKSCEKANLKAKRDTDVFIMSRNGIKPDDGPSGSSSTGKKRAREDAQGIIAQWILPQMTEEVKKKSDLECLWCIVVLSHLDFLLIQLLQVHRSLKLSILTLENTYFVNFSQSLRPTGEDDLPWAMDNFL